MSDADRVAARFLNDLADDFSSFSFVVTAAPAPGGPACRTIPRARSLWGCRAR